MVHGNQSLHHSALHTCQYKMSREIVILHSTQYRLYFFTFAQCISWYKYKRSTSIVLLWWQKFARKERDDRSRSKRIRRRKKKNFFRLCRALATILKNCTKYMMPKAQKQNKYVDKFWFVNKLVYKYLLLSYCICFCECWTHIYITPLVFIYAIVCFSLYVFSDCATYEWIEKLPPILKRLGSWMWAWLRYMFTCGWEKQVEYDGNRRKNAS